MEGQTLRKATLSLRRARHVPGSIAAGLSKRKNKTTNDSTSHDCYWTAKMEASN